VVQVAVISRKQTHEYGSTWKTESMGKKR